MKVKFLLIFFLFFISNFCWSQAGKNPFDIEHRLDSNTVDSDELDLFDPIDIEDLKSEENKLEESNLSIENPFEVSHIPLRSSEVEPAPTITGSSETVDFEVIEDRSFFPFWMILFSCILLAIVMSLNKSLIKEIRKSIINENVFKQLQRTESNGRSVMFQILYVIFFINISLFAYLAISYFSGKATLTTYGWLFLGLTGLYLMRHFFMTVLGWIFPIQKETQQFNFAIININIAIGLALILINLIIAYGPSMMEGVAIYLGISLIIIAYLIRQLRGLFISYRFLNFYKFHFFIYLCTCEIAPLLILYKFLSQ